MKRYRRLIIIFMMIVINVLVTKSEYLNEEEITDAYITKHATFNFEIKYKMATSLHKLSMRDLQKAHSARVLMTRFICPKKKQKHYNRAIENRIYSITAYLECIKSFCNDIEFIDSEDQKHTAIIPDLVNRSDIMLKRVRFIVAEVDSLFKNCQSRVKINKNFPQEYSELVTNMEEYEERIDTFFKKYCLSGDG